MNFSFVAQAFGAVVKEPRYEGAPAGPGGGRGLRAEPGASLHEAELDLLRDLLEDRLELGRGRRVVVQVGFVAIARMNVRVHVRPSPIV